MTTEVSAKCCLTNTVGVLMPTVNLCALAVRALKLLLNSTATPGSVMVTDETHTSNADRNTEPCTCLYQALLTLQACTSLKTSSTAV